MTKRLAFCELSAGFQASFVVSVRLPHVEDGWFRMLWRALLWNTWLGLLIVGVCVCVCVCVCMCMCVCARTCVCVCERMGAETSKETNTTDKTKSKIITRVETNINYILSCLRWNSPRHTDIRSQHITLSLSSLVTYVSPLSDCGRLMELVISLVYNWSFPFFRCSGGLRPQETADA